MEGAGPAESQLRAYKQRKGQQRAGRVSRATSLTSEDLARFSLKPYLSLTTFSLSVAQHRRAGSEPAIPFMTSQEEPEVLASAIVEVVDAIAETSNNDHVRARSLGRNGTFILTSIAQTVQRELSLAPTEIEEPEPEDIAITLNALGIKVRDFAYPSSSSSSPPTPSSSSSSSSSRAAPQPAAEIFDQFKGIAEYEYRLQQNPRGKPIPGKTTRRLITLGWVSPDEVSVRLADIDWRDLQDYDARGKEYPWRPVKWTAVPTPEERAVLLATYEPYIAGLDRSRRILEAREAYLAAELKLGREMYERAEAQLKEVEERERRHLEELVGLGGTMGGSMPMEGVEDALVGVEVSEGPVSPSASASESVLAGKKRTLEHTPSTPNASSDFPKRTKLLSGAPVASTCASTSTSTSTSAAGPSSSSSSSPSSLPTYRPIPQPPQQYPAPLQAYDPDLYPDAARIINAVAPRPPVVLSGDPTPPNSDDEGDGDPHAPGGGGGAGAGLGLGSPGRHALQRQNKGLAGALGRTQTFSRL
ncbi:hypothetical protein H0H92_010546 [Tricholoma furcatifolium]|nr:hypothetical protein H0H92_010546 [Tricholoma furcatifolium]